MTNDKSDKITIILPNGEVRIVDSMLAVMVIGDREGTAYDTLMMGSFSLEELTLIRNLSNEAVDAVLQEASSELEKEIGKPVALEDMLKEILSGGAMDYANLKAFLPDEIIVAIQNSKCECEKCTKLRQSLHQ